MVCFLKLNERFNHGQSLSGSRRGGYTPMMILLGAKGAKPCIEAFQYLNTIAFASNRSAAEPIFYHPLFSPPMNWMIFCLAPL